LQCHYQNDQESESAGKQGEDSNNFYEGGKFLAAITVTDSVIWSPFFHGKPSKAIP
jgi:hypothetical protein